VLGTVGEPINEEAWHWYDDHIGKSLSDCRHLVANGNRRHHDFKFAVSARKPSYATLHAVLFPTVEKKAALCPVQMPAKTGLSCGS